MDLTLTTETRQLIEERMRRGGYDSADAVIRAGLSTLDQQESLADFGPGEMDRLVREGLQSGQPLNVETFFAELAELRRQASAGRNE